MTMGRRLQLLAALALAPLLAGCGSLSGSSGAMQHMARDLGWEHCPATVWLTGVVVPGEQGEASLEDDQGVVHMLIWGTHNTGVVDWNRRYKLGGRWFNANGGAFWACAGAEAVVPQ